MRMKSRRTSLLPLRREPKAKEEQLLEGEPQMVGQRRIFHMSNAMCVESLAIMQSMPSSQEGLWSKRKKEGGSNLN
jgi:hypothetical protein